MVIVTFENGGGGYVGLPDLNKPYHGWKMTLFDGGIHTPYRIKWPEKITACSQYHSPVAHIDIFQQCLPRLVLRYLMIVSPTVRTFLKWRLTRNSRR